MAPPLARSTVRSKLRRSLSACTAEGTVAEVVGVCCGNATSAAVLTGWALHVGMSAQLVGLVAALPVTSQVLQIVGAFLTTRFGHRRTALVAVAISRQAFLPLALLPWLPIGPATRHVVLLGSAAAHHGLGIVASNAWSAWMGEMVPARFRGRYFGRRTALCTVAGGAFGLAAGFALDRGERASAAGPVLQGLALLSCVMGALSVWLMSRQHAGPPRTEPTRWALHAVRKPLADPRARRVVAYSVAWNAACGLSAPFFGLYVLRELNAGYVVFAACGAGYALARIASSAAWGRAVDRAGARQVLVVCTVGLALSPVAWACAGPSRLWPLAIEIAAGGLLFGGHGVASFALPLSIAPERERPFYLAAIAVAGGTAFVVTSALGGALAEGGLGLHAPVRVLFVASAALRLWAAAAAFALPRSRPAQPPMPLFRRVRAALATELRRVA